MGFSKHSETDPLVLLANEIEQLQGQIQLMEVCINEARLAAEEKFARLEEQYRDELSSLEASLVSALESARAENSMLRARMGELEPAASSLDRGTDDSAQPSSAVRGHGEAQGAPPTGSRCQIEGPTMKTGDDTNQLAGEENELQAGATKLALEQSLQIEIDRLRYEAQEKNRILQDRNDELVRVKTEMDRLHERLSQLESSTSRTQAALAGDTERVHAEFQAHLAFLQAELSQKQWALEEKQAAARTLEQKYRQEIESLRRKLAERDRGASRKSGHFFVRETESSQEERLQAALEHAEYVPGMARFSSAHGRWPGGFGQKRRWRS